MSKTKIQWTQHVWNCVRGCSMAKGSEAGGCLKCYAALQAARNLPGMCSPTTGAPFAIMRDSGPRWTGEVELIKSMLNIPLRRRKPTTYFVNSMSDLFHESLPDEAIDRVFAVMSLCPQHTFQVLTKRAARLPQYFADLSYRTEIIGIYAELMRGMDRYVRSGDDDRISPRWPLPLQKVWLGVSCEDQKTADERVPLLLQTPAAVRFLSCEPLLSGLDLSKHLSPKQKLVNGAPFWVIVGGESGPGARPCDLGWIRSIRDQCAMAGVACFIKQLGADPRGGRIRLKLKDRKGGDMSEWPEDVRLRQMPEVNR
jgi:protein gp37